MKTYQDLFSYMKSASAIMIAALLAVACGGGGGGSSVATVGISNGNIAGELGSTASLAGGTLLYDSVSDYGNPSVPSIEFSLQFYGSPYNYSGGIIAAQGVMTVQDTSCNIPVGQYQVETSGQAGQYVIQQGGAAVTIPYLVANGPAAVQFSLQNVSIFTPNQAINRDVYGVQHQYRMSNYNSYISIYVNNYPTCSIVVY